MHMYLQKVICRKTFFLNLVFCWHLEGQWWKKEDPDPDTLVIGMDPRIRIRIHTKMSWIRNTGCEAWCKENLPCLISPGVPHPYKGNLSRYWTDKNSSVFIMYKASNFLGKCQIKTLKGAIWKETNENHVIKCWEKVKGKHPTLKILRKKYLGCKVLFTGITESQKTTKQ